MSEYVERKKQKNPTKGRSVRAFVGDMRKKSEAVVYRCRFLSLGQVGCFLLSMKFPFLIYVRNKKAVRRDSLLSILFLHST